jgi:hypothetical protein
MSGANLVGFIIGMDQHSHTSWLAAGAVGLSPWRFRSALLEPMYNAQVFVFLAYVRANAGVFNRVRLMVWLHS